MTPYQKGQREYAFFMLERMMGNLLIWAEPWSGDPLTDEWLDTKKAEINDHIGAAQNVVESGDPLWSQLTTTRSLCLKLARLLWEFSKDRDSIWKAMIEQAVKDLLPMQSQYRQLGQETNDEPDAVTTGPEAANGQSATPSPPPINPYSRARQPKRWRPILTRLERLKETMPHNTFINRTTEGKPGFKYHRSPESTSKAVALLLDDLGSAYDDTEA